MMHFSRYFVIAVNDSHMGLGFADRSDSFDLNVSLQDHFKGLENAFNQNYQDIACLMTLVLELSNEKGGKGKGTFLSVQKKHCYSFVRFRTSWCSELSSQRQQKVAADLTCQSPCIDKYIEPGSI